MTDRIASLLIGHSLPMRRLRALIAMAAPTMSATVGAVLRIRSLTSAGLIAGS